jgi:carbonic anhydrase
MSTIDYVYRFNPKNGIASASPASTSEVRKRLEDGNRVFAKWMQSCRTSHVPAGEHNFIVPCSGLELGMNRAQGGPLKQAPFAVVLGCSDARVPIELLFGQGCNDPFVIRVGGNVLGDVCLGSVEFALGALADSLRCLVVLGHSGCGAVAGAVDCYLSPENFWSRSLTPMLKSILERIFVSVREGARALKQVWGADARQLPGYREALIEIGVCVNAARSAFELRHEVERAGRKDVEVLYGAFSLCNYQVSMPLHPGTAFAPEHVNLADAPTDPAVFRALAIRMAEMLKPSRPPRQSHGHTGHSPERDSAAAKKGVRAGEADLMLRPDDHLGRERSH